jgi:hypothetical protein
MTVLSRFCLVGYLADQTAGLLHEAAGARTVS